MRRDPDDDDARVSSGVAPAGVHRVGGGFFARAQEVYNTSLHLLVLLLDRDNLKILERRRPGATITGSDRRR